MRHFVLTLLFTVALPATAQAPEFDYRVGCHQDKLYVQIKAEKAGLYTLVLPSDVCGPSI